MSVERIAIPVPPSTGLDDEHLTQPIRTKSMSDLVGNFKKPEWLIPNLLEKMVHAALFGEMGCGKSASMLDMAIRLAMGLPIHGQPVEQTLVLLICNEGRQGAERRIPGWLQHHGNDLFEVGKADFPFVMLDVTHTLRLEDMPRLLLTIEQAEAHWGMKLGLCVIDTHTNTLAGDENNPADNRAHLECVGQIKDRGCAVLELAHSGHGEKGRIRGHSSFPQALDVELRAEKAAGGHVIITNTKLRDAPGIGTLQYRLLSHPLTSELGDKVADVVCATECRDSGGVSSPRLLKAYHLLVEHYELQCRRVRDSGRTVTASTPVVSREDWRAAMEEGELLDGERDNKAKSKAFYKIAKPLMDSTMVVRVGETGYRPVGVGPDEPADESDPDGPPSETV